MKHVLIVDSYPRRAVLIVRRINFTLIFMTQAQIATLKFLKGKSKAEIAKEMETTRQNVFSLIEKITGTSRPIAESVTNSEFEDIENIRKILSISLNELAKEMGIGKKTLQKYVYNRQIPKDNPNLFVTYADLVLNKAVDKLELIYKHLENLG